MTARKQGTPTVGVARFPKPTGRRKATPAEAKAMDREAIRLIAQMRSGWLRLPARADQR